MAKGGQALGPVVATLNLKGGVGKTTVSAHVFRVVWSMFRIPTLLIDFDPQFNLSQTLFRREDYHMQIEAGRTIMAVMEAPPVASLFEVNTSKAPPPDPVDVSAQLWRNIKDKTIDLRVLPGDFRLMKYSLMADHRQLETVKDRFFAFIRKCRQAAGSL